MMIQFSPLSKRKVNPPFLKKHFLKIDFCKRERESERDRETLMWEHNINWLPGACT